MGEEDVPGDLDLDVTRAVVTNRVTSDAHAPELVAHTRVLEGITRRHTSIPKDHGRPHPLRVESEHRTCATAGESLAT